MEFACIVITDYKAGKPVALPPTEIIPEQGTDFFDYEQKYMPGKATRFTPARCSPETIKKIQTICIDVMRILGIENLARIDGFVTLDGTVIITDPNTFAGMAPSSFIFRQAAEIDMSHTQLINHLIETELARYNMLKPLIEWEEKQEHTMNLYNNRKIRVAVLLGGRSHEREISLESGRNIFYKLSPQKYDPIAIFIDRDLKLYHINQALLVRNSTKEIALGLEPHMALTWDQLPAIADFVFIGLHGGEGENGSVQGVLEMLGLPYNGSSILASALCMDKFKTTSYLKAQGLCVPQNILISHDSWNNKREPVLEHIKTLGLPLIAKPHDDGCSVLVSKAYTISELIQAIELIFADGKQYALVEEYIKGIELTAGVIGNAHPQALPPSRIVTSNDILSIEEKFLPGAGENQTPAPLPTEALDLIKKTIEKAYKVLNCKGYARIDFFYQHGQQSPTGTEQVVIIEVNTLPGLTPATCIFHQAAEIGMKPMDFIDLIVQLGFQEHTKIDMAHVAKPEQSIANNHLI
jgi:UDP-N-acetylmuramate--alanine ligase